MSGAVPVLDEGHDMDTLVRYAIRAHGTVSKTTFGSYAHAARLAEDVYGVDNADVSIVKVTTTFEVVAL